MSRFNTYSVKLSVSEREKVVALQIDEMHAMQGLQYRGVRITGVAENSSKEQADYPGISHLVPGW